MKRFVFFAFAILSASVANADLVLGLAFDDGTTSKTVLSGDTVFVDLFLIDTDGSTPMTADGLISGGGRLFQSAGAAVVVESAAPVAGTNPGFPWGPAAPAGGQPGDTIASAIVPAAVPFLPVGVGLTSIHIARFTLDVTGADGDTAVLTSDALAILTGNLTGAPSFADLDAVLTGGGGTFGSVGLTVGVPEPSSLALVFVCGGVAAVRRRRKRRRQTEPQAAA